MFQSGRRRVNPLVYAPFPGRFSKRAHVTKVSSHCESRHDSRSAVIATSGRAPTVDEVLRPAG
jgi:hypothetical protein